MRAARGRAVLFSLVFGAGAAGAEPPAAPTPNPQSAPQHVTVPSLPGDRNKEGTVRPDGAMPTDSEGYAVTKRYDPGAPAAKGATPPSGKAPATTGPGGSGAGAAGQIPVGPAPAGKMTATGENYVQVRGTLVSVEPGKTVTIKLQRTGVENTYALAQGASVAEGLEPGKTVRVRVLAAQKGKVADRVELVVPTPAPKK